MGDNLCHLPDIRRGPKVVKALSGQITGYQLVQFNIKSLWLETEGEGILIASLDTGCDLSHQDLVGATVIGHNFHDDNKDVTDRDAHGSHTIGIMVAQDNDIGVVGIAPKAKVLVIKVLGDEGWGYSNSVAKGILFAIEQKADIISMSLGSPESDPFIYAAIKKAYAANIPVICAAGNSGDVGYLDYPARYDETISVGALDKNNIRADFSQTGERLDFMAPGVDIISTVPTNQYQIMSGSSMSTPLVAGIVALMLAKHKKVGGHTPINTVEDVRDHLKKACIDLDQAGKDNKTGFGIIDVRKAIKQIMGPVPNAPVILSTVLKGNNWDMAFQLPAADIYDTVLTGLKGLTVAMLMNVNEPFNGMTMEEILEIPGVHAVTASLTDDQAGKIVHIEIPILPGKQYIAAACSD